MTSSTNAPARNFGEGYYVRGFQPNDTAYIIDIDAKCSEMPWAYDQWMKNGQLHTGSVATFYGTPVGFAIFKRIGEYAEILKLAVKPQYRRQKLGLQLLSAATCFARDMGCHTLSIVVPETMLADPAIPFLMKMGFKAVKPMIRDCFSADGKSIDGVKFVTSVPQHDPENANANHP